MSPEERRLIVCEPIEDVTVVSFMESRMLDELNIKEIGDQLLGLVEKYDKKKILLDFSNVEYMSSAALGKLITLHNKAKAASGEARMCCIHPNIFEVFKITQLDRLFLIHSTREDALKAFGAA